MVYSSLLLKTERIRQNKKPHNHHYHHYSVRCMVDCVANIPVAHEFPARFLSALKLGRTLHFLRFPQFVRAQKKACC